MNNKLLEIVYGCQCNKEMQKHPGSFHQLTQSRGPYHL